MGNPFSTPTPKIPAPPPLADEAAPLLREISRQATQADIRKTKRDSFLSLQPGGTAAEPYRAPGSSSKTGPG